MMDFKVVEKGSFDPASKKVVGSVKYLTEKQAIELLGPGEPQVERGMTWAHHWPNYNKSLNRPCSTARASLLTYIKHRLKLDTQKELYIIKE